ncbi:benzoate transporter, partial [Streptomyces sp. SID10244]|nr:benzoate transporter [Streptomyces sp. SID10244]
MTSTAQPGLQQPIVAGIVTALVGFTSSFAVVIAGLRAVGASAEQAASGLLALTVIFGLGIVVLSVRTRAPITL